MMFWFLFAFVGLLMTISPKMRLGALEAIWLIWATLEGVYRVAATMFSKQLETARQTDWYRNSPLFKQSDKQKAGVDDRIEVCRLKLITELVNKYPEIIKSGLDRDLAKAIAVVVVQHTRGPDNVQKALDSGSVSFLERKMNVYVLDGETFCEQCGKAMLERGLPMSGPCEVGDSDCVEHCAKGPNCLNPTIIDEQVCGCFLENDLTEQGVKNLRKMMLDGVTPVVEFWVRFYDQHGYQI